MALSQTKRLPPDILQGPSDMTTAFTAALALPGTRWADYLRLTRPRLCSMALVTVAAGAVLASGGTPDWRIILHALVGAALVAAGASALNQWWEREVDAQMRRTRDRPLPAGRLAPGEVLVLGIASATGGVVYLAVTLAQPLAAVVAALTLLSYVFVYTPLKRRTPLNTLVGAIPGALPPVIGWSAVRGSLNAEIGALFVVLFLWQVPHFLAIAWIYRVDYDRAGLCMLPAVDRDGGMIGRQMICYCLALIAASLAPLVLGATGPLYLAGALLLGIGFLACAVRFFLRRSLARARAVLQASLIYLPALLIFWLVDHISHG
jgi:protoheme IX farnesyltransferase